jgi:hypothetical protein
LSGFVNVPDPVPAAVVVVAVFELVVVPVVEAVVVLAVVVLVVVVAAGGVDVVPAAPIWAVVVSALVTSEPIGGMLDAYPAVDVRALLTFVVFGVILDAYPAVEVMALVTFEAFGVIPDAYPAVEVRAEVASGGVAAIVPLGSSSLVNIVDGILVLGTIRAPSSSNLSGLLRFIFPASPGGDTTLIGAPVAGT